MPASRSPVRPEDEKSLMTEIWDPEISENLYKWVMFTFPWGKENTPLYNREGPRTWQREDLDAMTDHIASNKLRIELGQDPLVYQSATSSGRGPGKSTFVAWANLWLMSTQLGSTAVNSANTEQQLKTRTWAEVGKWHAMMINSHWFEKSTMALTPSPWFKESLKTLKIDTGYYYAQAQLWSEQPDSFAGVHNQNGFLLVFDEASGIPEPIWTVSEGFFTDPILHRYWLAYSNPRRNVGRFFSCFHEHRNYWRRRNLDSRTVEGTDKTVLNQIIEKYGEDSDEARIEVKGEFPRQGDKQFISRDIIENAIERELEVDEYAALIMSVDPARYGDDTTVIGFRQGRDARSIPFDKMKGADNMQVANRAAHWINTVNPDAVCIDAGAGSGIIDRLRELGYKVHEIWFGGKPDSKEWYNKRTELWALCRDWLGGGCISNDPDLKTDLASPEYHFLGASDRIMLQSKEDMKKKGMASPDNADALCLTFAVKVPRRDSQMNRRNMSSRRTRMAEGLDYDVFS